jgi:hypothetical protein
VRGAPRSFRDPLKMSWDKLAEPLEVSTPSPARGVAGKRRLPVPGSSRDMTSLLTGHTREPTPPRVAQRHVNMESDTPRTRVSKRAIPVEQRNPMTIGLDVKPGKRYMGQGATISIGASTDTAAPATPPRRTRSERAEHNSRSSIFATGGDGALPRPRGRAHVAGKGGQASVEQPLEASFGHKTRLRPQDNGIFGGGEKEEPNPRQFARLRDGQVTQQQLQGEQRAGRRHFAQTETQRRQQEIAAVEAREVVNLPDIPSSETRKAAPSKLKPSGGTGSRIVSRRKTKT